MYIIITLSFRITPAYAGNTSAISTGSEKLQDHPRLRGKHVAISRYPQSIGGSPPLTRETHREGKRRTGKPGITPAYAGNTNGDALLAEYDRDHPRLRGKHVQLQRAGTLGMGSPPLTRETPSRIFIEQVDNRITPAYAGNTLL